MCHNEDKREWQTELALCWSNSTPPQCSHFECASLTRPSLCLRCSVDLKHSSTGYYCTWLPLSTYFSIPLLSPLSHSLSAFSPSVRIGCAREHVKTFLPFLSFYFLSSPRRPSLANRAHQHIGVSNKTDHISGGKCTLAHMCASSPVPTPSPISKLSIMTAWENVWFGTATAWK